MPTPEIITAIHERRKRFRFQMEAELRYQFVGRGQAKQFQGTGQALDISSKALAFRADGPIDRDMRLKVSLAWPAKLGECRLRLNFEGVVLRTRGNLVVVSIERPDFRTAGKDTGVSREEIGAVVRGIEASSIR